MSGIVEKSLVAVRGPDAVPDAMRFGREKSATTKDVHFVAVNQVEKLVNTRRSPVLTNLSVLVSTASHHQVGGCQVGCVHTHLDRGVVVDHLDWRLPQSLGVIARGWLGSRLVGEILAAFGDTIRSTTSGGTHAR